MTNEKNTIQPANALTPDEMRQMSVQVKQSFHTIADDLRPVFQQAWQTAPTVADQQKVNQRWEQLQQLTAHVNAFNEAVNRTVIALRIQRNASIVELDNLIEQLRQAAHDQRNAPVYDTDPDSMELDRVEDAYRKYRAEVAEVVVATEDRVNSELEYERDSFYGDAYPLISESVIADLTTQIAVHADTQYANAQALMRYFRASRANDLTTEQKDAARDTLRKLLDDLNRD